MDQSGIREALTTLGELLAAEGEHFAVIVTGGATLNLLGVVRRATSDVDVIARADRDEDGTVQLHQAEPFPPALRHAIRTVARDLGLDEDWMNTDVGKQWSQGLPPETAEELTWERFGDGLDVGLVGRQTLIALKLFAAVDRGAGSVHAQDLVALDPTDHDLARAREWVLTQDAAPAWPDLVDRAIDRINANR
ncbi:MAG: hypothetical protein R6U63_09340 [Longimicrobiales bacterium]